MKISLKRALTLLLVTPFLMANSPAPMPTEVEYSDISVSCELLDHVVDGEWTYQMTITNNGELYARLNSYNYFRLNGYYASVWIDDQSLLFDQEVLPPGQTKTVKAVSYYELDLHPESDEWSVYASDVVDTDVTFENPIIAKKDPTRYELTVDIKGRGDYYYSAILDLTYQGERYAVEVDIDVYPPYTFYTLDKELNLDELTINKITAFRSSYQTYRNKMTIVFIFIPILVLLGLLLLGAAGIIIPLCVRAHRRKKNNAKSN